MKYEELQNIIEDIKLSFGDGAISKVNTMHDEKAKIISISINTSTNVVVFSKDDSLIHRVFNESLNYLIKAKDNNLIISFDIKYE